QLDPLTRADCLCAAAWPGSETFRAWLSTAEVSAAEHVEPAVDPGRPYCLPDGNPVATDWADLIDPQTPLLHAIDMTETGATIIDVAWTGSDASGAASPDLQCISDGTSWTTGGIGTRGVTSATDDSWTNDFDATTNG